MLLMKTKLISPNAKCRILGCRTCVPYYGYYPGMPQSHCPRCGMINSGARDGCEDFCEPLYPESDTYFKIIEWFRARKFMFWRN